MQSRALKVKRTDHCLCLRYDFSPSQHATGPPNTKQVYRQTASTESEVILCFPKVRLIVWFGSMYLVWQITAEKRPFVITAVVTKAGRQLFSINNEPVFSYIGSLVLILNSVFRDFWVKLNFSQYLWLVYRSNLKKKSHVNKQYV